MTGRERVPVIGPNRSGWQLTTKTFDREKATYGRGCGLVSNEEEA